MGINIPFIKTQTHCRKYFRRRPQINDRREERKASVRPATNYTPQKPQMASKSSQLTPSGIFLIDFFFVHNDLFPYQPEQQQKKSENDLSSIKNWTFP